MNDTSTLLEELKKWATLKIGDPVPAGNWCELLHDLLVRTIDEIEAMEAEIKWLETEVRQQRRWHERR